MMMTEDTTIRDSTSLLSFGIRSFSSWNVFLRGGGCHWTALRASPPPFTVGRDTPQGPIQIVSLLSLEEWSGLSIRRGRKFLGCIWFVHRYLLVEFWKLRLCAEPSSEKKNQIMFENISFRIIK